MYFYTYMMIALLVDTNNIFTISQVLLFIVINYDMQDPKNRNVHMIKIKIIRSYNVIR